MIHYCSNTRHNKNLEILQNYFEGTTDPHSKKYIMEEHSCMVKYYLFK